jgi:hypothetical protein
MLPRVVLVRTDVSEERSASFIRVTRIGEPRTTLAVISYRRTLWQLNHVTILYTGSGRRMLRDIIVDPLKSGRAVSHALRCALCLGFSFVLVIAPDHVDFSLSLCCYVKISSSVHAVGYRLISSTEGLSPCANCLACFLSRTVTPSSITGDQCWNLVAQRELGRHFKEKHN